MRLGIMQPYFFPYLGHFGLIANTDQWVVFDITQYTPKSYMSRNEILKAGGGRQQIFAELSNRSIHMQTHEALLRDPEKTRMQVLGSLSHYKRKAPFYDNVCSLVHGVFDQLRESEKPNSLVNLNVAGLSSVCKYLGLKFEYQIASEMKLDFPHTMGAGDWAPSISKQLGAHSYLNPIGGQSLFDAGQFKALDIELQFLNYMPFAYATRAYPFEPNLSVLDVLMWNSPEAVIAHLSSNCFIETASV